MKSLDLGEREFRALARFRHQLRRFLGFSEAAARRVGLEPRQHQLLLALRGLPEGAEPTVQTLADQLVLKHHTVVGLLDRSEAAGLIRRRRSTADRRRAHIALTRRGTELLRRLTTAHVDELQQLAPALVGSLDAALRAARRQLP